MKKTKACKFIIYCTVCLLGAALAGTLLLACVFCIPVHPIKENIKASYYAYYLEGDYYEWAYGFESTRLDNYTDSLMLQESAFLGTGSVFRDAMNCSHIVYKETEKKIGDMIFAVANETLEGGKVKNYRRYWHGYLIWMKPLLFFASTSEAKIFNMVFQLICLGIVLYVINDRIGAKYAFAFLVAICALNPITTAMCFEFTSMFYITLAGSSAVILSKKSLGDDYWKLFLWIGIATAFFDYLTYPIVGLGVPLILLLLLRGESLLKEVEVVVKASIVWCIGYAGMWVEKWMFASIILRENAFKEGVGSVQERVSGKNGVNDISFKNALISNLRVFYNTPTLIVLVLLGLLLCYFLIIKKYRFCFAKDNLIYLLIGIYPFVWYFVVRNHSVVHCFFTHRTFMVFMFSVLIFIICSLKKEPKISEEKAVIENKE